MAVDASLTRTAGYVTVASYKMSSQGISRTLYQPQVASQSHTPSNHTNPKLKPDLESINELSRTSSNKSAISLNSEIYIDPYHDFRIVLNFTKDEIDLVRSTWKQMISDDLNKSIPETKGTSSGGHTSIASSLFCVQFYSNLLAMDADLEKMFPSIKHQAVSFAGVLSTAIHSLENLEKLNDYLTNLGKRHSRILGIDPPHFELMGIALMKTFHDRFGVLFTLELERCWARLFTYLANSILQFGIDPVLKNNKEFNTEISKLSTNTTLFEPSSASISQLNQQRSASVASASTRVPSVSAPNPNAPFNNSQTTIGPGKLSKRTSKIGKMASTYGPAGSEAQEEKCVVM